MRLARLLLICLTGCVPYVRNGSQHYLIIGFGIVSVNSTNQAIADVSRANVLGIYGALGPSPKLAVGYTSTAYVSIKTNSNILIDITKTKVEVPCLK